MSYISEHALYGVGEFRYGLGATETYGTYLQTQANVAARYLGLSAITVDGNPGPNTYALLQAIASKVDGMNIPDTAKLGAPLNVADMKANAKAIGDFIRNALVPAVKAPGQTAQSVAFEPMDVTVKTPAKPGVPAAKKPAAKKPAGKKKKKKPAGAPPAFVAAAEESFLQRKVAGIPMWVLLTGTGVAALLLLRGGRKSSAPAAVAIAAPKVA